LFDFPESYERLEEIVKTYPANKLDLLNANRNVLGSMFNAPAIFVIPKYW
jgi:hypothetical protein